MSNKVEFTGVIIEIRDLEDAIRASKKYTESVGTLFKNMPIQGSDFQSRVLTRNYEVYPDVKVSWDMPVLMAWGGLVFAEAKMIVVKFRYDYRENKAGMRISDGPDALDELKNKIPGFSEALVKVTPITELVKPIIDSVKYETK